ncbi:MAG: DICT sensory domain-containing protein [Myxococcota bacterium]
MGNFSVYEASLAALKTHGQAIQAQDSSGSAKAKGPGATRLNGDPATLLRWCKSTEGHFLRRQFADCRVYAGFERLSRARFVEDRYQQISVGAEQLFVYGQADCQLAFPCTATIKINTGPMLKEWFLIVVSETYCGMLSARDLDGFAANVSPRNRRFEGIVTYHTATIESVANALHDWTDEQLTR